MSEHNLATEDGLRMACESIGGPANWEGERAEWIRRPAQTIEWVRAADWARRSAHDFQERLWERNHVAAVGQGRIPVGRDLDDEGFRRWLAAKSMDRRLPPVERERRSDRYEVGQTPESL